MPLAQARMAGGDRVRPDGQRVGRAGHQRRGGREHLGVADHAPRARDRGPERGRGRARGGRRRQRHGQRLGAVDDVCGGSATSRVGVSGSADADGAHRVGAQQAADAVIAREHHHRSSRGRRRSPPAARSPTSTLLRGACAGGDRRRSARRAMMSGQASANRFHDDRQTRSSPHRLTHIYDMIESVWTDSGRMRDGARRVGSSRRV